MESAMVSKSNLFILHVLPVSAIVQLVKSVPGSHGYVRRGPQQSPRRPAHNPVPVEHVSDPPDSLSGQNVPDQSPVDLQPDLPLPVLGHKVPALSLATQV